MISAHVRAEWAVRPSSAQVAGFFVLLALLVCGAAAYRRATLSERWMLNPNDIRGVSQEALFEAPFPADKDSGYMATRILAELRGAKARAQSRWWSRIRKPSTFGNPTNPDAPRRLCR